MVTLFLGQPALGHRPCGLLQTKNIHWVDLTQRTAAYKLLGAWSFQEDAGPKVSLREAFELSMSLDL